MFSISHEMSETRHHFAMQPVRYAALFAMPMLFALHLVQPVIRKAGVKVVEKDKEVILVIQNEW